MRYIKLLCYYYKPGGLILALSMTMSHSLLQVSFLVLQASLGLTKTDSTGALRLSLDSCSRNEVYLAEKIERHENSFCNESILGPASCLWLGHAKLHPTSDRFSVYSIL